MPTRTEIQQQNFHYRLKRQQFNAGMIRILKAFDEWRENNPSAATCQQIADLAGVHQTYIQRFIRVFAEEGYVKLWTRCDGTLKSPGVFVLKGWKSIEVGQEL